MEFECSGCGACCRRVGRSVMDARVRRLKGDDDRITNELADFPYELLNDGSCSQLQPDGKCMVYETRPLVCSVEKSFGEFAPKGVTKAQYFTQNAKVCNKMIDIDKLDASLKVREKY